MKITIITLFRAGLCKHHVAAVKGTIKKKDRLKLAERLDLLPEDDESDELSFCEYKLVDNVDDLEHIPDIDTSGCLTGSLSEKAADFSRADESHFQLK